MDTCRECTRRDGQRSSFTGRLGEDIGVELDYGEGGVIGNICSANMVRDRTKQGGLEGKSGGLCPAVGHKVG